MSASGYADITQSGCYGCAYYVRSSRLRYFAVWTTGATASCNVYKALCTAVGGNLVSVFGACPNSVIGRIFDFGNNCWYESHLLMVCSATCVRVATSTTGYGAWLTSTCATNLAAGVKIQGIY